MIWPFKPKHDEHLFIPFAVQHAGKVQSSSMLSGTQQLSGEFTRVLHRCSCGAVTVHTFDGTWTLDQLQGRTASGISGDEILKSLAEK